MEKVVITLSLLFCSFILFTQTGFELALSLVGGLVKLLIG